MIAPQLAKAAVGGLLSGHRSLVVFRHMRSFFILFFVVDGDASR